MRQFITIIGLLFSTLLSAQNVETDYDAIDSLYREDQFYFSFSYNTLQKRPDGFSQTKFSPGISLGFLRDMPLNKKRTFSIGAGIGYSLSVYNQNLIIAKNSGNYSYDIIGSNVTYSKDKLSLNTVDIPIEIRWRNSTFESHKFWRVYGGIKMSYLFYDVYKLNTSGGNTKLSNIKDLNDFTVGTYLSVGWNTVNLYTYYGLTPIFKSSAKINDKSIDLNQINFGLMFYIL